MPESLNTSSSENESATGKPVLAAARPRTPILMNYARICANEAKRFRREFTRENVGSFFKTLAWVVPLTVLIWIYAEREQELPIPDVSVAIQIKSTDPQHTATLVSPTTNVITCTLNGPRSKVDQVIGSLSPSSPIIVNVDTSKLKPGITPIPTSTIANDPKFKDNGVTIENFSPSVLEVAIDHIEEDDATVVKPANLSTLADASFTPQTVKVKGPSEVLQQLKKIRGGQLTVTADIAALPILHDPGTHAQPVALLPIDPASDVSISPATVTATLTVKNADVTFDSQNVTVEVLAPPALTDRFRIEPQSKILASVTVIGPADKMEAFKAQESQLGKSPLLAALPVDDFSVQNPKPTPLVIYNLPDGIRLADAPPQMSFITSAR
ncbi:MAG: CdaR family protein [Planctomycetota bacterium]|nr:CdaR family protein [Planctomycetota bacterium]